MPCGIDVSTYQKKINWTIVKSTGLVQFAYIRATFGLALDGAFVDNWSGCAAVGLLRGAYHFYKANVDPIAQADAFFAAVGQLNDNDLPPVIDFEVKRNGENVDTFVKNIVKFMRRSEELFKRRLVVYTGGPIFDQETRGAAADDIEYIASHDLWLSAYVTKPDQFIPSAWKQRNRTWKIWQRSGDVAALGKPGMRVAGVPTVVDYDVTQSSSDDMLEWIRSTVIIEDAKVPEQVTPPVEENVIDPSHNEDAIVDPPRPDPENHQEEVIPNPEMTAGFFKVFLQVLAFVCSMIFKRRLP